MVYLNISSRTVHVYSIIINYYFFRITKENRIFAGLWYGHIKPDMSLFLKPLAVALRTLYTDGN